MGNAKIAFTVACMAMAVMSVHGAYQVWDGPAEGLWSGFNWSSCYFATGDTAVFRGDGTGSPGARDGRAVLHGRRHEDTRRRRQPLFLRGRMADVLAVSRLLPHLPLEFISF